MLETILAGILTGSPWAMIAVLGWVIYRKDQHIAQLNADFGKQLDSLHGKRLDDSKEREEKYQETAGGLKDSLGTIDTRLQVMEAKLPSSGGD